MKRTINRTCILIFGSLGNRVLRMISIEEANRLLKEQISKSCKEKSLNPNAKFWYYQNTQHQIPTINMRSTITPMSKEIRYTKCTGPSWSRRSRGTRHRRKRQLLRAQMVSDSVVHMTHMRKDPHITIKILAVLLLCDSGKALSSRVQKS